MWLRDLFNSVAHGRIKRTRQPRRGDARLRPAAGRLAVEALEDRCVPAALFSLGDVTVLEGNDGTANALVTINLSEPHPNNATVNYSTANGTATAGSDYNAVSGKLTFAKGQTSKTILVPVRGDRSAEPDEYFRVQLSNATKGAKIADGTGFVTIMDDDPRISINDVYAVEGNDGKTELTFTVSLSVASSLPVTVNYATTDGSASADSDYIAASGQLTFAPGQTSQIITVQVNGDRQFEPNETFLVNLSTASSNAQISRGTGYATIIEDDPQISIAEAYNYGDYNAFTFTVSLSAASTEFVTVLWTTMDGTALAGTDYVAASGTLIFEPGVTTMTITVEVLDPTYYDNKYFTVQLSNASPNALFANQAATGWWYYYDYGYYDPGYGYYDYYDYGYYWY